MRILITYAGLYPHVGGISTHISLLAKGLRELGHEIDFLTYSDLPSVLFTLFFSGPASLLGKVNPGLRNLYLSNVTRIVFRLAVAIKARSRNYDLINAHHIFCAIASEPAAKRLGVPMVLTVHTYHTYELVSPFVSGRLRFLETRSLEEEKKAYHLASHILAVDRRIGEYLRSSGVPNEKIGIMLNSVDTTEFSPRMDKRLFREQFGLPDDKPVILCPRRLVEKNGVVYPVKAGAILKERMKNFLLVYAGDGELRETILRLAKDLRLEENLMLLGFIDHDRMNMLYNAADVVVIPSVHSYGLEEASSISALEAMASGIPVVASEIGGLKDIIRSGYNGTLVPEKDERALADAVYIALTDMTYRDRIVQNSTACAKSNFSYITRARYFLEASAGMVSNKNNDT